MTEGKRASIFVGVLLNIFLLNESVTSNLEAHPDINHRIDSRAYERFGHPNSSITNQREFKRHRSDSSRFRIESSRRILNAPLYPPARFSFIGRLQDNIQFDRQRRIFREPRNNRQERNRALIDPLLNEHIQRRFVRTDFDDSRYSEAPSDRSIRRSTFSQSNSRFFNSESIAPLKVSNNRDRRIASPNRDTGNSEFVLHRTRELQKNTNQFGNHRTRLMRTLEADRDQNSNRMLSKNSETSRLTHSFLESTLSHYFPHTSISSLELHQINDFIVSAIAGFLLYDIMGAIMQKKGVAVKKESYENFVDKMVFAVRKMVTY